jgi:hypothetical protein
MKVKNKEEALDCLKSIELDLEMLQNGEWVPDEDSIEASLILVRALIDFVEV